MKVMRRAQNCSLYMDCNKVFQPLLSLNFQGSLSIGKAISFSLLSPNLVLVIDVLTTKILPLQLWLKRASLKFPSCLVVNLKCLPRKYVSYSLLNSRASEFSLKPFLCSPGQLESLKSQRPAGWEYPQAHFTDKDTNLFKVREPRNGRAGLRTMSANFLET